MIDSHCHLADETFAPELPEVITRARTAGLERTMVILEAGNAQEAAQAGSVEALGPRSLSRHQHGPSARLVSTTTTTSRPATSSSRSFAPRWNSPASSTCRS